MIRDVLLLFSALFLCAFTPIFTTHDSTAKVDQEISNIENSVQDRQFSVKNSTPNLADLRDGEIMIISTGTYNRLVLRVGQDLFTIQASCITVRR